MKKCKNCGAILSDDKTVCLDCGATLGRSMTDAEEEIANETFESKLDNMTEQTDVFYIPLRDKLLSIVCLFGVVAAVILMIFVDQAKDSLLNEIPDNVKVIVGKDITEVISDGNSDYIYPSRRMDELSGAAVSALAGILAFIVSALMLLAPRLMWLLSTWQYSLFYGWDTSPSYWILKIRKFVTYLLFVIGVFAVSYGWLLYFS